MPATSKALLGRRLAPSALQVSDEGPSRCHTFAIYRSHTPQVIEGCVFAGNFCPGTTDTSPTTCPAGSFCPTTGLSSPTTCTTGHKCPSTGMTSPSNCGAGNFQGSTGQTSCTTCPAGVLRSLDSGDLGKPSAGSQAVVGLTLITYSAHIAVLHRQLLPRADGHVTHGVCRKQR